MKGPLVPILLVLAVLAVAYAVVRFSHTSGSSSSTGPTIRSVTTSTVGELVPPDSAAGSTDTSARANEETRLLVRGDCVRQSNGQGYVGFDKVSCDGTHDGEVAWIGEHPAAFGDAYPDGAAWQAFEQQACGGDDGPVASWLGPHANGGVRSAYVYPSAQSWSEGDRRVVCIAEPATGSLPAGRQGVLST